MRFTPSLAASEWAVHVEDVMVRRTGWHYYHADAARKAEQVADWMADLLGWTAARRADEIQRYRELTGSRAPGIVAAASSPQAS